MKIHDGLFSFCAWWQDRYGYEPTRIFLSKRSVLALAEEIRHVPPPNTSTQEWLQYVEENIKNVRFAGIPIIVYDMKDAA